MNAFFKKTSGHAAMTAGYCAVFLVTLMILAKAWAYNMTGSASILSSLMDSILDSLISLTALASVYYANRPPDEDHRWGHGKMEAISALLQASIIAAGGAFVVFESVNRLFNPAMIEHHSIGIGVMAFSIILSIMLVAIQRFALKQSKSLALEADSAHYSSDIFVNLGVMGVLFLGFYGAPAWIDPLFAICVAFFLAFVSYHIGNKALNMLMDRELPESERSQIITLIENHKDVAGWHDLRMHLHGVNVIVSFDIEVDGQMLLHAAHDIAKDLEDQILKLYPQAEILIHIDPQGYTEDTRHRIKGVHH